MITDDQERASIELARLLDRELNAPDQEARDFEFALLADAEEREHDARRQDEEAKRQEEEAALLERYLKESGEDSEVNALLCSNSTSSRSLVLRDRHQ